MAIIVAEQWGIIVKSMTGYGKGEATSESHKITIELKSVNNRYLEINSRLSKYFPFADDIARKIIQERLKRGTVELLYSYEVTAGSGNVVELDLPLAREYAKAAKLLACEVGIPDDFAVSHLIKMPDILTIAAAPENREELEALFAAATEQAVCALEAMRKIEGEGIKNDFTRLIGCINSALLEVKLRARAVVSEYKEKLTKRIAELCTGVAVDEARFTAEVAFFADKCDINEEISRLDSHIGQFLATMESDDQAGRRLDFITQEMNREINTMGSKANDLSLTRYVIEMKNELEKIKEQIRNVE